MRQESVLSVGDWMWDARSRTLRIETEPNGGFDEINGTWTLQSLSHVLDGLSRSRLISALHEARPGTEILCRLGLSSGTEIRMIGTFQSTETASGFLASGPGGDIEAGFSPGPGLRAVFQPIVSLESGKIAGFEALARWDGDAPGLHSGRDGIGDKALAPNMLIRASEALANWQRAAPRMPLFVNVNLTAQDLTRDDLPALVEALVSGHGFDAGQLRIEITEQAALRNAAEAVSAATVLKAAGAGLVLDDFGSGHSSFSWLAALPADGLKVDSELVAQLGTPRVKTILRSVTRLASDLKMSSTAEGIEDLAMITQLRALGFEYAQGFAFSRPVSAAAAETLLLA